MRIGLPRVCRENGRLFSEAVAKDVQYCKGAAMGLRIVVGIASLLCGIRRVIEQSLRRTGNVHAEMIAARPRRQYTSPVLPIVREWLVGP